MIKQNDVRCYPVIQKMGCFVRSCGAVAEIITAKELTAQQINELWDWSKQSGHINLKDEVKHSAPIITRAIEMLGGTGKVYEIGTFNKGKLGYYKSVSEAIRKMPKHYIQKVETVNENTHFRVVAYDGKRIFDPYDPPPKVAKILYSLIYAYCKG